MLKFNFSPGIHLQLWGPLV